MKTSLRRPALATVVVVVCASTCAIQTCTAFVSRSPLNLAQRSRSVLPRQHENSNIQADHAASSTTARAMSTIPGDDEDNTFDLKDRLSTMFKKPELPPLPENLLILGGDVGWLFFYSFLDHTLHDLFVRTTASIEPDIIGIHAAWIDLAQKPAEFMAASSEYGMSQPYSPEFMAASSENGMSQPNSPALDSAGICAVLFATLWLVNGYFQQSFSFKNTVSCESHTAVQVAAKTWIGAALGMLVLAYSSDAMSLAGLQHQVGGLTQTDWDFILDSLPVMVCWRWMIAYIFNGWFS